MHLSPFLYRFSESAVDGARFQREVLSVCGEHVQIKEYIPLVPEMLTNLDAFWKRVQGKEYTGYELVLEVRQLFPRDDRFVRIVCRALKNVAATRPCEHVWKKEEIELSSSPLYG